MLWEGWELRHGGSLWQREAGGPRRPRGSAPGMRLLDGGNSERQGQPWMSAPTVFNTVIVHVGAVIFGE